MAMPLKSHERRTAVIALRRKGNFVLNQEKGILKPVRKPPFCNANQISSENHVPCPNCLGYFKNKYLWRHAKICASKINKPQKQSRTQHLSEMQTFLATTGLLGNFLNKSRLKREVFDIMRPDKISFTAKKDALICLYGESYLNKHKRKQINIVVSNKMREMGRLKLALQSSIAIENFIDVMKPEYYEHIIASTKIISGFCPDTNTFKASSLALHMGTNLKYLCDVARKAIMTKNPLFGALDKDQTMKNIAELKEMISGHWCNDISSLAHKILNENKFDKPKLLPTTEDVQLFNKYVMNLAINSYDKLKETLDEIVTQKNDEKLKKKFDERLKDTDDQETKKQSIILKHYKILCETTLTIVLVFNRKRVGEVQYLTMENYEKYAEKNIQTESLNALTDFEKTMSHFFKRVVVLGKGSKPVPILFTKKMQTFIDMLLKVRKSTDIVPECNKYLFANPGSYDRWVIGSAVLRKFASRCGAKNPDLLTSGKFRKQIATILQLMNFEQNEMEQVARFMGHTEKTHREFYR